MAIFPDAAGMDFPALVFMMGVYGYILMMASQTISAGSEMLLLMYGPGIVGGLLIPILGAIPDCAIILISGLGDGSKAEIQHELSVGVGTLVGSTVMLLTVPWAVGIYMGSREWDHKSKEFRKRKDFKFSLTNNGVTVVPEIAGTAKIMIISSLSYFIIQIPAFFYKYNSDGGVSAEAPFALTGVIVTFIGFCAYCWFQYSSAQRSELTKLQQELQLRQQWKKGLESRIGSTDLKKMIFEKHDKDKSGYIEKVELKEALRELGLNVNRLNVDTLMKEVDIGHKEDRDEGKSDGRVSFNEFKSAINNWIKEGQGSREGGDEKKKVNNSINFEQEEGLIVKKHEHNESEEEEEDDEEGEEEYWHLSDFELKLQACGLLLLGTVVCTVFSDPMVDVISNVGLKLNISPFYISFVVTPLASNASEVIAGLIFAKKKTTESISLTLSTLHGAATMNSTLSLCIFMSLIYFRALSWSFSAEVITVVVVIVIVGLNALKNNIKLWQAVIIGSLYPLSILFVYTLENLFGLD
jgi:Ca2+/Na+ antiporter